MSELLHELHIDPMVIAAQVIGFILLWILLSRFLFRPVMALLQSREEEVRATYERANAERESAEQLKSDFEQRITGIEAEARARVQDAVREAQTAKEEILAEARSRSEDIIRRGHEDLDREREKVLAQLREEVVNVSLAAAAKIIGESLDESRHRRLVSEFTDKLGADK